MLCSSSIFFHPYLGFLRELFWCDFLCLVKHEIQAIWVNDWTRRSSAPSTDTLYQSVQGFSSSAERLLVNIFTVLRNFHLSRFTQRLFWGRDSFVEILPFELAPQIRRKGEGLEANWIWHCFEWCVFKFTKSLIAHLSTIQSFNLRWTEHSQSKCFAILPSKGPASNPPLSFHDALEANSANNTKLSCSVVHPQKAPLREINLFSNSGHLGSSWHFPPHEPWSRLIPQAQPHSYFIQFCTLNDAKCQPLLLAYSISM